MAREIKNEELLPFRKTENILKIRGTAVLRPNTELHMKTCYDDKGKHSRASEMAQWVKALSSKP